MLSEEYHSKVNVNVYTIIGCKDVHHENYGSYLNILIGSKNKLMIIFLLMVFFYVHNGDLTNDTKGNLRNMIMVMLIIIILPLLVLLIIKVNVIEVIIYSILSSRHQGPTNALFVKLVITVTVRQPAAAWCWVLKCAQLARTAHLVLIENQILSPMVALWAATVFVVMK